MEMITLYQVSDVGYSTGVTTQINEAAGYQYGIGGWVPYEPPSLGEGQYAIWMGQGWVVTPNPPPPAPPEPVVTDAPAPAADPAVPPTVV